MSIFNKPIDTRPLEQMVAEQMRESAQRVAQTITFEYDMNAKQFLDNQTAGFSRQLVLDYLGNDAQAVLESTKLMFIVAPEKMVAMPPHIKNEDGTITLIEESSSSSSSEESTESETVAGGE